jgi:translation elongation factor EF-Tu-like GTPase
MVTGAATQMDGATQFIYVLLQMVLCLRHITLGRQVGIPRMVVFMNKSGYG